MAPPSLWKIGQIITAREYITGLYAASAPCWSMVKFNQQVARGARRAESVIEPITNPPNLIRVMPAKGRQHPGDRSACASADGIRRGRFFVHRHLEIRKASH
jgi:hypothetical protein